MLFKQRLVAFLLSFTFLVALHFAPVWAQDNPDAPLDRGAWTPNAEVAEVAKGIRRSQDFLDWILTKGNVPRNGYEPIISNWKVVRNTSYALAILVVVGAGFLIMLRRNKDINVVKFIPLFIGLVAYVTFSFAITKQLYQLTEGLIKSFYRLEAQNQQTGRPKYITTEDLLHVEWSYENVEWSRRAGIPYDESSDTSLLLTRLTTWTYMTMSGILILRQVILWFFITVSPFIALLLPFPLIRNTAKIWVGEFFRWLFYGLLFAVFLRGLVEIWRRGIPLGFTDFTGTQSGIGNITYPNGVNYQLAGPNYRLQFPGQYSGVHNIDTYVNYIVALIMLWVVIILPWVLLRIFRDALSAWLKSDSANDLLGQLGTLYSKYTPGSGGQGKSVGPTIPHPPASPSPTGTGQALELPFRKVNIVARDVSVNQDINNVNVDRGISQAATDEMTKLLGMSLPKITDIARMEMNANQMMQSWSNLQKLGNPNAASSPMEQQRIGNMRAELSKRAQSGDERAQNILRAAQSAATVSAQAAMGTLSSPAAQGSAQVTEDLTTGASQGAAAIAAAMASNLSASKIVSQAKAGTKAGSRIMPVVNKAQSVSLNDYEEVKKMWMDHYQKGDIPQTGKFQDRKQWIKQDIEKAETAVAMLGNINPQLKQKGLEMVAALLPFLLLGGFSEQETIAYMKAKVEAAKQVLEEMEAQEQGKKQAENETESVELERGQQHAQAESHLEAEVPEEPTVSPETIEQQAVANSLTTNDMPNSIAPSAITSNSK